MKKKRLWLGVNGKPVKKDFFRNNLKKNASEEFAEYFMAQQSSHQPQEQKLWVRIPSGCFR
jgi:hypothetical protein